MQFEKQSSHGHGGQASMIVIRGGSHEVDLGDGIESAQLGNRGLDWNHHRPQTAPFICSRKSLPLCWRLLSVLSLTPTLSPML
jgi:hypothetical protein